MATEPKDRPAPTGIRIPNVSRESLTGTPARSVRAEVASVTRETLVKGPGVYGIGLSRETLVDSPNEPTSAERLVTYAVQATAGRRETLDPESIHSWTQTAGLQALYTRHSSLPWARSPLDLATLIAITADKAFPEWPRSPIQYRTAVSISAAERAAINPDDLRGEIRANAYRTLVALSRTRNYDPVSAVYAKTEFSLASAGRSSVAPISPLSARSHATLVTQSRLAWIDSASAENADLVQLVAKLHVPAVPYSPPHAASHVGLVTVARQTPRPFAPSDAAQTLQQIAIGLMPETPHSATATASYVSLAAVSKEPQRPLSQAQAALGAAVVAAKRDVPSSQTSPLLFGQGMTLAATRRQTESPAGYRAATFKALAASVRSDNAFPLSQAIVALSVQLPVASKTVPPIEDQWSASPVAQARTQAVLGRWTIRPDLVLDPTTGRHVQAVKVQYALGRDTRPPTGVYDPDSGKLARGLFGLTTQRRETSLIVTSTVYGIAQSVALADTAFPPQSAVTVNQVTQPVAVADTALPSSDTPLSDLSVDEVHAHVALTDTEIPSGDTPLSDLAVDEAFGQAVLGDTEFPGSDVPLSDTAVESLASPVALGDTNFPDGDTPRSEVEVGALAQTLVVRDQQMPNEVPASDTSVHNVIQAAVLRDPAMLRLPSRPAGPRPVISIAIY